ncbi:MAG TPA: sugar phosphate isomerase/epimerase family protein [Candidatus Bathyarchaeia archaeon]|nr:sugar phosphate isomerase/epimerase family protein [Candidatus Bathyarchaeia archaeon]
MAFDKQCSVISNAGFAALEISPWMQGKITNTTVKSLKKSMRKNHLSFSGFTALYPPNMVLASPIASSRHRNISYTNHLIKLTHELMGRTLVWGSGRARTIPPGVPTRKGYAWLVELLKGCGSLASEKKVKIAIEPLNRFESGIIHNMHEALSLAETVNLESIGTVYDIYQASLEEESFTKPILLANRRLAAVHVSDCNRKIPGRGHLQFEPVFDALKRIGYDGYVTLEATLGPRYREELREARKYLERVMS